MRMNWREVQVEAPVDVADEARVLRHAAPERGERAAEARLAERPGDGPRERRGDAGQRLADVDVAPDGLRVAALGEPAARAGRACTTHVRARVARELDVPRDRLELLEAQRDFGELRDARVVERGAIRLRDVDLGRARRDR